MKLNMCLKRIHRQTLLDQIKSVYIAYCIRNVYGSVPLTTSEIPKRLFQEFSAVKFQIVTCISDDILKYFKKDVFSHF